jgi:hypothetical protein
MLSLPDDFFQVWPQETEASWLLILDGLDEVPIEKRSDTLQWLTNLAGGLTRLGHRLLVTSRPTSGGIELDPKLFCPYKVLSFDWNQACHFAGRWFGDNADRFLQQLEQVPVGALAGTPLLLTMAALVFQRAGRLPKRRAQLYDEFVGIWLGRRHEGDPDEEERRDLHRIWGDLFSVRRSLVERLALWCQEELRGQLIPIAIFTQQVERLVQDQEILGRTWTSERARQEAPRCARVLWERSGILRRQTEAISFLHPTFREYLSACALSQRLRQSGNDYSTVIGERPFRYYWETTIAMLAETCDDSGELVKWLAQEVTQKKGDRVKLLHRCWESSDAADNLEVRAAVVKAFVVAIKESEDDYVREHAARALSAIPDPCAVGPLIAVLRSPGSGWLAPYIRRNAAYALGLIGDTRATGPLVQELNQEKDEHQRGWILQAVARILDTRKQGGNT